MNRLHALSVIGIITVAAAVPALQVLSPAQQATQDNLKTVALATMMYTADFDDVLPRPVETKSAFAAILPYCKSPKIFYSANPGSHILFNLSVGGFNTTKIKKPAETILYYDEKPWPDGSHLVAYCDGHAALVTATDWKKVKSTLKLAGRPEAKPLPKDYWKQFPYAKDLPG